MKTRYYLTNVSFNDLMLGMRHYQVSTREYCVFELPSGQSLIATNSDILIGRLSANPRYKEQPLGKDDLFYLLGDEPVKSKNGNPNLMPLF